MKTKYIPNWSVWVILCEAYDYDPYEIKEFSIDTGGGNSRDFEYIGDIPKKRGDK